MECPNCGMELKREILDNGQVILACPNCNYWVETGELAPSFSENANMYRREE